MNVFIKSLKDLLGDYNRCEIINPLQGNVVRILTKHGDKVEIDAITVKVTVPLDTEVRHQPWMFDRGNLLISVPGYGDNAKLCTEADVVRYEDGTEACILPATARN